MEPKKRRIGEIIDDTISNITTTISNEYNLSNPKLFTKLIVSLNQLKHLDNKYHGIERKLYTIVFKEDLKNIDPKIYNIIKAIVNEGFTSIYMQNAFYIGGEEYKDIFLLTYSNDPKEICTYYTETNEYFNDKNYDFLNVDFQYSLEIGEFHMISISIDDAYINQ